MQEKHSKDERKHGALRKDEQHSVADVCKYKETRMLKKQRPDQELSKRTTDFILRAMITLID